MTRLARNFTLQEMTRSITAARRGLKNEVPLSLLGNLKRTALWLQLLRDRLSESIDKDCSVNVISGYRAPDVNRALGGSVNSAHMQGLGADFYTDHHTVPELQRLISELMTDAPFDQCIEEFGQWIHIGLKTYSEIDESRGELLIARRVKGWSGKGKTTYEITGTVKF